MSVITQLRLVIVLYDNVSTSQVGKHGGPSENFTRKIKIYSGNLTKKMAIISLLLKEI